MFRAFRWSAVVLPTVVFMAGCEEHDAVGPTPSPTFSAVSGGEFNAIYPVRLSLSARGDLSPGATVIIEAKIEGLANAGAMSAKLIMPEEFIERRGQVDEIPADVLVEPVRAWDGMITRGTATVTPIAIVLPQKPGYYRVVLAAETGRVPNEVRPTQTSFYEELWLWVDFVNGQTSRRFDENLFSNDLIPVPGMHRFKADYERGPDGAGSYSSLRFPEGGICTDGYVRYYHADTGLYDPVPRVWVTGAFTEKNSFRDTVSIYTDESGYYRYCSDRESGLLDAKVYLNNTYAYDDGVPPIGYIYGTGRKDVSASYLKNTEAFVNVTVPAHSGLGIFGERPSRIEIRVDTIYNGTAYYGGSYIFLYADDIAGTYGLFVGPHEYGHHFMAERIYQGALTTGGDSNCSQHYWLEESDLLCAYSEGFPDYYSAVVQPSGMYAAEAESGAAWTPGEDGSLVEGAVAAFLFDLTDPANEVNDPVYYPYSYLISAMRTCRVYANTASGNWMWVIPDGVDFLTYCLENQIDSAVTASSTYFTYRSTSLDGDPTAYSEEATEPASWSASAIRSLWTGLLYGQ